MQRQRVKPVTRSGAFRDHRAGARVLQPMSVLRRRRAGPDLHSQLASIVEHSNDAIFGRTLDGTITTWNAAAVRIFGYTADEIVGASSRRILPPGGQDELTDLIAGLRRGRVVEHFVTEHRRKDGRRIWVSLTLYPTYDASRRLIGFSTIAQDISEQRRLHVMLARRELELEDLFEAASVGLVLVSPRGEVQRANRVFLSILERSSRQVVNRPLKAFHPDGVVLDDLLRRLAKRETVHNFATEFMTVRGETRHVLMDAEGFWDAGRLVRSRWFVRDISRRRQLERELLEVSDAERRHFAQELHDGLGQQLGGIAYLVNVLRENLGERGAREAASATRIFELVRKAIDDTRRMARGLSPIREEPEGLTEALRELANQTSELKGIRCHLVRRKPVVVADAAIAGHLYRIAQEAVNNAVKHAAPRVISISLNQDSARLTMTIADDGRGIGRLSPNRKGLGLRIMQYRAGLIHAAVDVTDRRTRGTQVTCVVPLLSAGRSRKRG